MTNKTPTAIRKSPTDIAKPSANPFPDRADDDPPPSDEPNYFVPAQMSSGGIVTGIESCIGAVRKSAPNLSEEAEFRYCSCTVDALAENTAGKELLPEVSVPNWEQLKRCGQFAQSAGQVSDPSPFKARVAQSDLSIVALVHGCDRKEAAEGRSGTESVIFCSCWADAILQNAERPYISPSDKAKCRLAATYRASTGTHMTLRQFRALPGVQEP